MTSTFPTSRNSSQNLKNGLREIQHKKETLMTLEIALKKRINEFRELCLKEGELTGHLPVDYPLQPREPIPQVRRRMTRSNGNIPNELISTNSILQAALRSQSNRLTPSSTSSTISVDEQPIRMMRFQSAPTADEPTTVRNAFIEEKDLKSNNNNNNKLINFDGQQLTNTNRIQPYYEEETKPFQMSDFYKYSSKLKQQTNNNNNHNTIGTNNNNNQQHYSTNNLPNNKQALPARPPRYNSAHIPLQQHQQKQLQQFQHQMKPRTQNIEQTLQQFSINCEKARRIESNDHNNDDYNNRPKTTRQLQEDVARGHNHLRIASCDDQILASRKLIEKSGHKLIEATAKAIAGNPSLAERLNNLLPQTNGTTERY